MRKMNRAGMALLSTALVVALAACGGNKDDDKDVKKGGESLTAQATPSLDPALAALPQAPADFSSIPFDGELAGNTVTLGDEGRFQLPGMSVSVKSVTTLDQVVDQNTSEPVRPADGERFVVVQIQQLDDEAYENTRPSVAVLVEDGGQRTLVSEGVDEQPFLVSVGDDAQLVLAVDGRDFKASLGPDDLGQVEASGREGDHRQDVAELLAFDTAKVKDSGKSAEVPLSGTVRSVLLTQYLPAELTDGAGRWASPGQAFLLVFVTDVDGSANGLAVDYTDGPILNWSAIAGSETYKAQRPLTFARTFEDRGTAVIEVPAELREFSLTASASTAAHLDSGVTRKLSHGTRSFDVVLP